MIIKKSIHVKRPVETAFRVFTEDIGKWWPLKEGYSFGGDRADQILPRGQAGRPLLRALHGRRGVRRRRRHDVQPPVAHRVRAGSSPTGTPRPRWRCASPPEGAGTLVELEHRGWDAAGAAAVRMAQEYDGGWNAVLSRYAAA